MSVTPCASAASSARWMVTPSAIGSVNGTPISTTSRGTVERAQLLAERAARREAGGQIGDQRRFAGAAMPRGWRC